MSHVQRLRRLPVFLLVVALGACLDRPHRQAVTATVFAQGENLLLTQLGELYSSEIVSTARSSSTAADAASDAAGITDPERAARHAAAIAKAKADVAARWTPIWGTDQAPGAWARLRVAHDAWASRLEAGEEVLDEVADPAVQAALCTFVVALPAAAVESIHLPEGLLCRP